MSVETGMSAEAADAPGRSGAGSCGAGPGRIWPRSSSRVGVVMLMQPFSIDALQLLLRHHADRHGDVHHRHQVPGLRRPWPRSGSRICTRPSAISSPCKDSSFTVGDGEFFCLLGPSGCGKTTTLRMIAGLELPSSGRILLDGEDVTFRRAAQRDIAFVFQLFALYPHMTVQGQYRLPAEVPGHGPRRDPGQRAGGRAHPAHHPSARPPGLGPGLAATASGWRWAAPSCASPRPS